MATKCRSDQGWCALKGVWFGSPMRAKSPADVCRIDPTRVVEIKPADVKAVREGLGASQSEFALMIGVSLSTLQNWGQGRHEQWPSLAEDDGRLPRRLPTH